MFIFSKWLESVYDLLLFNVGEKYVNTLFISVYCDFVHIRHIIWICIRSVVIRHRRKQRLYFVHLLQMIWICLRFNVLGEIAVYILFVFEFDVFTIWCYSIQEKTAFIFCVEDRALFCRDCDEPIHSAGSLAANHQRFLATGIRVALSSGTAKEPEKNHREPPPPATNNAAVPLAAAAVKPPAHQNSGYSSPAWAVDDLLQLSDFESSDKV